MERTDILALMGELKLYGMRAAYDEVMASGIKRQHEPPRIVGDLLKAEIAEKQARSIKYQMTIAKLPLAKDLDGFAFAGTPILPSRLPGPASAAAPEGASTMSSIWSTGSMQKLGPAARAGWPIISPASTS